MDAPRVPVQIVARSQRVEAALKFAAGVSPGGGLPAGLCFLCDQIAAIRIPHRLGLRARGRRRTGAARDLGFTRAALGEVRMKVGQGITGTCVESMSPVTVNDARLTDQFEYFPQLAEERYPAFLAIPLFSATRPRGALVLQREAGSFSETTSC